MRRLILVAALILGCAAPLFAQISPDGTEGPTVTSAEGPFTVDAANQIFLKGVQIGGLGSKFVMCGGLPYVFGLDSQWWKRVVGETTPGWTQFGTRPTTCAQLPPSAPPPSAPSDVTIGPTFVLGDAPKVRFSYIGPTVATFTLGDNGATIQTQPASALVNGDGVFYLPAYTMTGAHLYVVSAKNAAGVSAAPGISVTVGPAPPHWRCTLPAAVSKYANGDTKVTLRCGPTFAPIKGEAVTVTK